MTLLNKSIMLVLCLMFCLVPIISTTMEVSAVPDTKIENGKVVLNAGSDLNTQGEVFAHVINKYNKVITFFSGIAAITFVGIFIKHFIELGAKACNPHERKEIIGGLLWSGLAAAACGSITFVVGVLYGLLA